VTPEPLECFKKTWEEAGCNPEGGTWPPSNECMKYYNEYKKVRDLAKGMFKCAKPIFDLHIPPPKPPKKGKK
jgi:hypothetical protein